MNRLRAFNPVSSLHSESSDDIRSSEEVIDVREVIAQGRVRALVTDIVNVEFRVSWESNDAHNTELAFFHGSDPRSTCLNHLLAAPESSLQDVVLDLSDEVIFIRESSVLRVLPVGINKSISDGSTSESNVFVIL